MTRHRRVRPMHIAVAHADGAVRNLITDALREDGHEVVDLSNVEELVSLLSSWTIQGISADLIVVGDQLGSRTGAEVATGIRDTAWDAPVVMVVDGEASESRADVGAADAVFSVPFDPDDLRTVALCMQRRSQDRQPSVPPMPEPAGLRVELVFRGVPLLDDLVYFVRNRAARLEAATGLVGRCAVRIQAFWRRGTRVYLTEVELESPGRQTMRLERSDFDLFSTIDSAFQALARVLVAEEDEGHDGWKPIRKRLTPLPPAPAEVWTDEPPPQLTL